MLCWGVSMHGESLPGRKTPRSSKVRFGVGTDCGETVQVTSLKSYNVAVPKATRVLNFLFYLK